MLLPSANSRLADVGAVHVQKVPNGEQVANLQAAILRYLADHPDAADTARGIARYWTSEEATPRTEPPPPDTVQRALDALVAQGRIACATLAGGERVYESLASNQSGHATRRGRSGRKR